MVTYLVIASLHREHVGAFGIFSKVEVFLGACNFEVAQEAGQSTRAREAGTGAAREYANLAPTPARRERYTIAIIGAIGGALGRAAEPETSPAMQIKFGRGHGRTTLPLVIIRLSRNCFYVLNGKARYLFRVCERPSFNVFLIIPQAMTENYAISTGCLILYFFMKVKSSIK